MINILQTSKNEHLINGDLLQLRQNIKTLESIIMFLSSNSSGERKEKKLYSGLNCFKESIEIILDKNILKEVKPSEKEWILNFLASVPFSLLVGMGSLMNFRIIKPPLYEIKSFITFISINEKGFPKFLKNVEKFENLLKDNKEISFLLISHYMLLFSQIASLKTIEDIITYISKKDMKGFPMKIRPKIFLITLCMIFTWNGNIINLQNIKRLIDCFKKYHKRIKTINSSIWFWRVYEDLLSTIYQNKVNSKKMENTNMFHYTSLETLDKILKNDEIKLNKLNNLLDSDEGKLLTKEDINAFSCSFTFNGDSAAFWKSYTNDFGVVIEIDINGLLSDSPYLVTIDDSPEEYDGIHYWQLEAGIVSYENDSAIVYKDIMREVGIALKPLISKRDIKLCKENILIYNTLLFKKKAFSFEEEYRVMFIDKKNILSLKPENYRKDNNSIYLKIPREYIKSIRYSPKIKNNDFKLRMLKNILKEHKYDSIKLEPTEINYKKEYR